MNRNSPFDRRIAAPTPGSQQGVVLFVALIVLVVMALAGLGMLRQMGGSNAIAGNVAFKENATSTADVGTEEARNWLLTQVGGTLNNDVPANGYRSTWAGGFDPTQYDWSQSGTTLLESPTSSGNQVRYIIHRLCEFAGLDPNDPSQRCSDFPQTTGASHGGGSYGGGGGQLPPIPFYRITTRVDGPRNTTSYTQVLMY